MSRSVSEPLAASMARWPARRWVTAAGAAAATFLIVAVPTDLIDTPFFSREIPPTWWSYPVLGLTALLSGLLTATYVDGAPRTEKDKSTRFGSAGALAAFFAVGCPVCNKLVLLALGATGAVQYFAPLQPALGAISIGLLAWAFVKRATTENACAVPARGGSDSV
ncbi:hypothetical protein KIH31_17560 [Paenarthrobacter sp. DKR-5]|uniref:hypothetical protein n=1 Tax=Paenarthrobacter sp. DKR-5 TaxID=2835535 RepID=UPI001BDC9637|nr:hypothetical protein [Paenarthrobacter sp. DKR-5]MBT1004395.1 hypothetical protein [Paenarthrobacter sp. DKR-5]